MAERHRPRPERWLIGQFPMLGRDVRFLALTSACSALLTVVQAVLLARAVDAVFLRGLPARSVRGDLVGFSAALAAKAILAGATEWVQRRTSARARGAVRAGYVGAVARLGPGWLNGTRSGEVVTAAGSGVEALDGWITRALPATVSSAVVPVIALVAIGVADWPSLVLLLVTLPLVPVFLVLVGVTTRQRMDRQWATLARLSGRFLDLVEGLPTLKVYGRSRAQVAAVEQATDRYRRQTLATLRTAFLSGLVLDLIATLSVALLAVTVGLRLDHGHLSLVRALVVLLLAPEVYAPLRAVGLQHHASVEARTVAATLQDAMRQAADLPEGAPAADAGPPLRLAGVGLRYPGRDDPALTGVDLELAAGEIVVLHGPSGAGKSSVLALLLGAVAPTEGAVLTSPTGDPLPTGSGADAWRQRVAWVPQRPRCTQATVGDEVRLGDPDADLDAVLRVCEAPPAGTELGEDGGWLSAGQRRRVALARALARALAVRRRGGHPLVLLDEPSEDLDPRTERVVASVVSSLAGWATVVVATHSPTLRAVADRCVLLDGGRVVTVEAGPGRRVGAEGAPAGEPVPAVAGPTAPPPAATGDRRLRLLSAARAAGAGRALLLAGLLACLGGVCGIALTATSVWLICRAAQHPNVQALALAVVGVRLFALAKALLRYGERLAAHDGALRMLAHVRAAVFAALEPLAPAGLAGWRRGDLLRSFTADVDGAQEALVRAAVPMIGAAGTALAAVALVACVHPAGAVPLFAGLAVAGAGVPLAVQRASGDGRAAAQAAGRRDALVTGLVDGLAELQAYGAVPARLAEIAAADADAERAGRPAALAGGAGVAASGVLAAVTIGLVAASAAAHLPHPIWLGVVTVAAVGAFEAVAALPAAFAALGRCFAGLARVQAVLDGPLPVPEPRSPASIPAAPLGVAVRGAALAPAPDRPPVVADVSFPVAPGERVALIGPSGSGKTTVLAAVLRLLCPVAGAVELSGRDGPPVRVTDVAAGALAPAVAGSLQGDHVFDTTLRDNLRVVAPSATDDDLDAVAARAGLGGWVRSLPAGWATPAGPDGSALSGGQRQRLLLARALLADPAVLVLDEPTAHLDDATAAAVMADLTRATADRTLLLSTHRRDGLDAFDRVVVVADGTAVVGPASTPPPDPADTAAVPTPNWQHAFTA